MQRNESSVTERSKAPDRRSFRAALASFAESLAIRWPAIAVLRLHWVCAWVVLANLVAWLIAPFYAGTTRNVGDSLAYIQVWFIPALAFALLWIRWQWSDRAALPARQKLPWSWSPGVATMLLAAMFSPMFVGGYAVETYVRRLRQPDELFRDVQTLGQKWIERDVTRARARDKWMWSESMSVASSAIADFFESVDQPTEEEFDILANYASRADIQAARQCIAQVRSKHPCDARLNLRELPGECQLISQTCHYSTLKSQLKRNINHITRAHRKLLPGFLAPHEAPGTEQLHVRGLIVAFVAFLGILVGCAGMFSSSLTAATCIVLAILAVLIGLFSGLLEVIFDFRSLFRGRDLLWTTWIPFALIVALFAFRILCRSERTFSHDLHLLVILLAPFFMMGLAWILYAPIIFRLPTGISQYRYIFPIRSIYGIVGAVTLLGFLVPPLLSKYRALPRAT